MYPFKNIAQKFFASSMSFSLFPAGGNREKDCRQLTRHSSRAALPVRLGASVGLS